VGATFAEGAGVSSAEIIAFSAYCSKINGKSGKGRHSCWMIVCCYCRKVLVVINFIYSRIDPSYNRISGMELYHA
jgi:hypothetical protein